MISYLQSTITDEDDYFFHSLLCIAEQDKNGAVGFIINRLSSRALNELQEFAYVPPFPLYEGGPVDSEHLYFLHRRPDIIEAGKQVSEIAYFGGNFKQAVAAIAAGKIGRSDIRIFIGYCGWDAGELEDEIKEGDWEATETNLFF